MGGGQGAGARENRGLEGYQREREKLKKASFRYLLLLTSSQRNELNNISWLPFNFLRGLKQNFIRERSQNTKIRSRRKNTALLLWNWKPFPVAYIIGHEWCNEWWMAWHMYTSRSSQWIKIGIDLSIDESIKIGKTDLIDIDCIDQSVEIDDRLVSFILIFTDFFDLYRSLMISFHLVIQKWKLVSCEQ